MNRNWEAVIDVLDDEDCLDIEEQFGFGIFDEDLMPNEVEPNDVRNINIRRKDMIQALNRHRVYNILDEIEYKKMDHFGFFRQNSWAPGLVQLLYDEDEEESRSISPPQLFDDISHTYLHSNLLIQLVAEAIQAMKGNEEGWDVSAVTEVAVEKMKAADPTGKKKICKSSVEKKVREAIAEVKKQAPLVKGFASDDSVVLKGNKLCKKLAN